MPSWEFPPSAPGDGYVADIRALEAEEGKLVKNQHVVSKVVLKGLAAPLVSAADIHVRRFGATL